MYNIGLEATRNLILLEQVHGSSDAFVALHWQALILQVSYTSVGRELTFHIEDFDPEQTFLWSTTSNYITDGCLVHPLIEPFMHGIAHVGFLSLEAATIPGLAATWFKAVICAPAPSMGARPVLNHCFRYSLPLSITAKLASPSTRVDCSSP